MNPILSQDVQKVENAMRISRRKVAWTANDGQCRKLVGLSAMRVYLTICVVFTAVFSVLCVKLLSDSLSIQRLTNVLLGPYDEAIHRAEDLGLLGKILHDEKVLGDKIEMLSGWANNSGCIPGDGLLFKNKCYILTRTKMSYESVKKHCKLRDGNVAFAQNEEVWFKILEYLWSVGFNYASQLWMGLEKNSSDGIWYYSNGEVASFTKWAKGNIFDEGFDCAQIRTDVREKAGLYDRRCSDSELAMCMFRVD
uniref:C-type lectin 1-like n=1 Tax=Styela clava TaxID=7725 RepID=UPI00193A25DE|nr:C-type lectin 1-like [Styela clava]